LRVDGRRGFQGVGFLRRRRLTPSRFGNLSALDELLDACAQSHGALA
jgi:hypothetical protein